MENKMSEETENKEKEQAKEQPNQPQDKETLKNVIKFGHFQLQTKDFWITLVAILTLFIISMTWLITFFNYKTIKILNEQNLRLITVLEKKQ